MDEGRLAFVMQHNKRVRISAQMLNRLLMRLAGGPLCGVGLLINSWVQLQLASSYLSSDWNHQREKAENHASDKN